MIIMQMSRQVLRGSAGDYEADEHSDTCLLICLIIASEPRDTCLLICLILAS